jgi:DNA mismatch repair protein MutS
MRVGYFSNLRSLFRDSPMQSKSKASRFRIQSLGFTEGQYQTLELDEDTEKDLEIFQSQSGGVSLFEFYNRTVTQGGAQVLRHRMQNPFAQAEQIRQTQEAIAFIQDNRSVFKKIPFYITSRAERYQRDPLMFVTQRNRLQFLFSSLKLKLFDAYHYRRIHRGAQYTCLFIRTLRDFLKEKEIATSKGELKILVEEINQLLTETDLKKVPENELRGGNFWRVLRLDQSFRIFDKEHVLRLLQLCYEIDAIISMADVSKKLSYVLPEILNGETEIRAEDLTYPQIEGAVSNNISLDQEYRLLFLTGPNMAGKTTFLRAVATALYISHLGMGVPARSFAFSPVDRLFSSITVSDNVHTGTSYFLAEVLRIKAVAKAIADGFRVIAIMDEPVSRQMIWDTLPQELKETFAV